MIISPDEQFTRVVPQSMAGRIGQFPLVRLLIAALFLVPVLALDYVLKSLAQANPKDDYSINRRTSLKPGEDLI